MTPNSEAAAIDEEARALREANFVVVESPNAADMPDWMAPLLPDLIARRGDEQIVVDVLRRGDKEAADAAQALARAVRAHPGWSLRVAVVPAHEDSDVDPAVVTALCDQADAAMAAGALSGALLLGSAAVEGALRLLLTRRGDSPRSPSPAGLIREAYVDDVLSSRQFDLLNTFVTERNRVAHGFAALPETDPEAIRSVLDLARAFAEPSYQTVSDLTDWFLSRYQDPVHALPFDSREGGYQWLGTGPHDAREVLASEFPDVHPTVLDEAAESLEDESFEWMRIEDWSDQ
jgi:hypothetical protein